MKKNLHIVALFMVVMALIMPITTANAQTPTPYVFDTTMPVASTVRADVDAWLATYNPSNGVYYAITYAQPDGMDQWIVCLAAIAVNSPTDPWTITDDADGKSQLIWLGTIRVFPDHSVEMLTDPQGSTASIGGGAMFAPVKVPNYAAGGGPNIRWPWQLGKAVMYGTRAVHNAGYSTYGTNMKALDLVSGSDFGGSAASDAVYASAAGEIDYVCSDGTSVTVRVSDAGTSTKLIYAHLKDNSSLTVGQTYSKGSTIATLVHGTFSDSCGYADQADNHWHLHWGFEPANNAYTVEGCVINTRTNSITCDGTVINTGGFITAKGSTTGYEDGGSTAGPTFWDYILVGFLSIFDRGILKLMPEHTSPTLLPQVLLNAVRFVLRIGYALLVSNFNMGPALAAIFTALVFRAIMSGVYLVFVFLRTVKALPIA